MKKFVLANIGIALVAAILILIKTRSVAAQTQESSLIVYDSQGRLKLPDPTVFRKWVFLGAPTTPNGLNNGKANFPEFHHVYVEQKKPRRVSEDGYLSRRNDAGKRTDSRSQSSLSRRLS